MKSLVIMLLLFSCTQLHEKSSSQAYRETASSCKFSKIGLEIHNGLRRVEEGEGKIIKFAHLSSCYNKPLDILIDAEEIFETLKTLISNAKHEVILNWGNARFGDPAKAILEALIPVQKRLQKLEAEGKPFKRFRFRQTANFLLVLKNRGMKQNAKTYFRHFLELGLDPKYIDFNLAFHTQDTFHVLDENHSKLAVIDQKIIHIGGANADKNNNYRNGVIPERDTAYTFEGEVAKAAQIDLEHAWDESDYMCGFYNIEKKEYKCGFDRFSILDIAKLADRQNSIFDNDDEKLDVDAFYANSPLINHEYPNTEMPLIFLNKIYNKKINLNNEDTDNYLTQGYLSAINAAKHSIDFMYPNFNDIDMTDALVQAIKRGVKVETVLGFKRNSYKIEALGGVTKAISKGTNAVALSRLYCKAYEDFGSNFSTKRDFMRHMNSHLQFRWFSRSVDENGNRVKHIADGVGAPHIKIMFIDREVTIVGSTNLDWQSFKNAREASLVIDDKEYSKMAYDKVFYPEKLKAVAEENIYQMIETARSEDSSVKCRAKDLMDPDHIEKVDQHLQMLKEAQEANK